MRRSILPILLLVAACDRKPDPPLRDVTIREGAADQATRLAHDPEGLRALRAKCRADRASVGAETCDAVSRANRIRFMGGGPSAYAPGVVSGVSGDNQTASR